MPSNTQIFDGNDSLYYNRLEVRMSTSNHAINPTLIIKFSITVTRIVKFSSVKPKQNTVAKATVFCFVPIL